MKLRIAIPLVVLLTLAVMLLWQQSVIRRLKSESAQLHNEAGDLARLRNLNARLAQERIDPAELKQLREGRAELVRLRGQVSQLRREIQEAKAGATSKVSPFVTEKPEASELPVQSFTANVTASIGWKQTLVTGGWLLPSGKRAFVLLRPTATTDANGVGIRSQIFEVPDSLLAGLGLDVFRGDFSVNNAGYAISAEQTHSLLKTLEKTDGVNMLSSPEIETLSGRQAQVQVVDIHTLPSGQTYTTGPTIDVVPTISTDKQTVELVVGAKLNIPRTPLGP